MSLDSRYAFLRRLAPAAGALALAFWRQRATLVVELKGPQDFVSRADREVEAFIRSEIAAAFPDDAFLGEETATSFAGPTSHLWIVDPIDGTHQFPARTRLLERVDCLCRKRRPHARCRVRPVAGRTLSRAAGSGRLVHRRARRTPTRGRNHPDVARVGRRGRPPRPVSGSALCRDSRWIDECRRVVSRFRRRGAAARTCCRGTARRVHPV